SRGTPSGSTTAPTPTPPCTKRPPRARPASATWLPTTSRPCATSTHKVRAPRPAPTIRSSSARSAHPTGGAAAHMLRPDRARRWGDVRRGREVPLRPLEPYAQLVEAGVVRCAAGHAEEMLHLRPDRIEGSQGLDQPVDRLLLLFLVGAEDPVPDAQGRSVIFVQ